MTRWQWQWQILFPLFLLVRCKQGHMHKVWSVCLCLHASRRKFQLKTLNINIYKYYIIYFTLLLLQLYIPSLFLLQSFSLSSAIAWVSESLTLFFFFFFFFVSATPPTPKQNAEQQWRRNKDTMRSVDCGSYFADKEDWFELWSRVTFFLFSSLFSSGLLSFCG